MFSGYFFIDTSFDYLRERYCRLSLGVYRGASSLVFINDLDFSCLWVVGFTGRYINSSLHEVGGCGLGQGVVRGGIRVWIARGYEGGEFLWVFGKI